MKKALMVSTIIGFLGAFERSDIALLQRMGYEVHCACNCERYIDKKRLEKLDELKVVKHHVPFARNPFSGTNIRAYGMLLRIMREGGFDLVHCHTPVGGVLGRLAAHRAHIPRVIYTAHGFHFFKGAPVKNWLLFYPVEKWMSRYTDVLITINREDYLLAKARFSAGHTVRIHGVGIELGQFSGSGDTGCRREKRRELGLSDAEQMLLSVGELDRDKNHRVVLEAMKTLAKEGFRFFIAGVGALEASHKEFIRENGLEDSVKLLGFRGDIAELLEAADIYVFPSLFEGLSVALMEAVAAKVPVACSQVRGNVDTVVTKESYFSPESVEQVVEVIRRIGCFTEEEKGEMVARNYENLQKYRLCEVQKEMGRIYRAVEKGIGR
ncbi:MAG: glycosyltransferase family 4 protein [Dorea sp.]|jgi:glycosyltransferase involved in cell wall biosynthesis|nr:glycosyltransferase family 4 protein [Dorea sp.]